ncbi:MAG: hypothetical protein Q4D51_08335 [Eubacteriales bacterium]|nr:hypothetical protein [Eubacteriales bacterium]
MTKQNIYEIITDIDDQYLDIADNFKSKKNTFTWMKVATLAACFCLICCSVPVLAATGNEATYNLLYSISPDIAQRLKPVNKSCVYNGIEMNVVAAKIEGDTAEVVLSMRDTEGNRLDETTDLFDSYGIHAPCDTSSGCSLIDYNEETRTAFFSIAIQAMGEKKLVSGDKITFSVDQLLSQKREDNIVISQIDMINLPSVDEFADNPDIRGLSGEDKNDLEKLIKPEKENAIQLTMGVIMTGYGEIDGRLHVQICYDDILNTDNHGVLVLKNSAGEVVEYASSISFWDSERINSYEEYIFDIPVEELKNYEMWGEFTTCNSGPIYGDWEVTFPLEYKKAEAN